MKQYLSEKVYNKIKELIIERKIKPGEYISEEYLQSILKTSRTPIREALRILQGDRLITIIPKKGAYLNKFSIKEIQNIYQIRIALEGLATRLATKKIQKEDLMRIKSELLDLYNRKDIQYEEVYKHSIEFHQLIVDNSDNELLIEFINKIKVQIAIVLPIISVVSSSNKEIIEEHLRIIEAIEKGDPSEAEKQVREHIQKGLVNTIDAYKSYLELL